MSKTTKLSRPSVTTRRPNLGNVARPATTDATVDVVESTLNRLETDGTTRRNASKLAKLADTLATTKTAATFYKVDAFTKRFPAEARELPAETVRVSVNNRKGTIHAYDVNGATIARYASARDMAKGFTRVERRATTDEDIARFIALITR